MVVLSRQGYGKPSVISLCPVSPLYLIQHTDDIVFRGETKSSTNDRVICIVLSI